MKKRPFEIFTDKFTVIIEDYSAMSAMNTFVLEFGTKEPIIACISYDRAIRGNYESKRHKKLPYCFIIKRNEPELPVSVTDNPIYHKFA